MKTRSTVIPKATAFVLLVVLTLALCVPVVAATNSTTLTTNVPESLTLLLELTGKGTITVNGVVYTKSGKVEIPRNSIIELLIAPDTGNEIKSVIYDGRDYTEEVKAGKITLPAITEDAELCVCFFEIPSTPQTGDSHSLLHLVLLMLILLIGMIVILSFWKKKEY